MTGYTRADTPNNIADGNIINAADLDGEYDAIALAFSNTLGHTHDGSTAEGQPITKVGPTQEVVVSTTTLAPKTTATIDIGSNSLKFKDFYFSGTGNVTGTITAGGFSGPINGTIGATTASTGAFTTLSASSTVSGTGFSTYLASPPAIGGTAAAAGAFTTLSASSTVSGTGFSTYLASPPAIGGTAPAAITGTTINGTTITASIAFAGPINGTVGATTPSTGAFTTLSASSTVSGVGFSTYLASPPAIGGTAAAAGAFTTLSASSTVSGTGFSTYLASPPAIGGTTAAAITGTTITANTAFAGPHNGTVGATTPSTGAFTTLSASSTVSGTGFSTYLASPPAIGGTAAAAITGTTITANTAFAGPHNGTVGATTPSTGAFTTLSASSTVSGTGFSTYLASPPAIGGTAAAAGAFTTLSASSTVSGTGFSTYLASPPAIGGTAAAAGSFTALSYSTTLTGGTGIVNLGSGQFYKDASGLIGIGVTPVASKGTLQVGTIGYTDTGVVAGFASSVAGYNQLVLQNTSNNAAASTNLNISNDAGTTTTNYGELGINSSTFTGTGSFSQAGNVYLAAASTDLVIGTYAAKPIRFVVNSGTTDAAVIDSSGKFGIGTSSPAVAFAVNATDAILVPNGTTAQRPTGAAGYIRYNTTTGTFEGYTTAWGSIGGGATGAGGDQVFYQNGQTVNTSYSITAGTNAGSFGPISVASGATVTVPSGSVWSIV